MDNKQTVHHFSLSSSKLVRIHREQILVMLPDKILELSFTEKIQLTRNSNTSKETLAVLATDKHPDVRYYVAINPNTLLETLNVLATDKDSYVRCRVARHPNTPIETLNVLATDKDSDVRYWVAQNPNATEITRRLVLMTNEQNS